MAFEVFDDVAFYWFLMAMMVMFVVPISYSFLSVVKFKQEENWTRNLSSCKQKVANVDAAARAHNRKQVVGWRGIGFILGWLLLIALATKLTTMQQEEMFTFNPYRILDIEEDASPAEIKKAED